MFSTGSEKIAAKKAAPAPAPTSTEIPAVKMARQETGPQAAAPKPTLRGLEAVALRNEWYRDRYSTVLRILFAVVIVAVIEGAALAALIMRGSPPPQYFAVDDKGSVIPIVPVVAPMLGNDAMAQWAGETARKAYNLDFVNWKTQLSSLRERFSDAAYNAYLKEMESSGNIAAVRDSHMIIEATAEPPVITKSGVQDGRYTWDVEVPLVVVTHYGGDKRRTQRVKVEMTITRVDNRYRPESGVVVTRMLTSLG